MAKIDNPNGYKNVLLHLKAHLQLQAMSAQPQVPNNPTKGAPAPPSPTPLPASIATPTGVNPNGQ